MVTLLEIFGGLALLSRGPAAFAELLKQAPSIERISAISMLCEVADGLGRYAISFGYAELKNSMSTVLTPRPSRLAFVLRNGRLGIKQPPGDRLRVQKIGGSFFEGSAGSCFRQSGPSTRSAYFTIKYT
jgi:hypothetical protein